MDTVKGLQPNTNYLYFCHLNPYINTNTNTKELESKCEIGNSHYTHAVAVRKVIDGEEKTVGHVPRKISAICSLFIC